MYLVVPNDKKKITESKPSFLWIRALPLPYHCLAIFMPEKGRIYLKSQLSWMIIPSPHLAFGMLHFWSFRCISQLFARKLYNFCKFTKKTYLLRGGGNLEGRKTVKFVFSSKCNLKMCVFFFLIAANAWLLQVSVGIYSVFHYQHELQIWGWIMLQGAITVQDTRCC